MTPSGNRGYASDGSRAPVAADKLQEHKDAMRPPASITVEKGPQGNAGTPTSDSGGHASRNETAPSRHQPSVDAMKSHERTRLEDMDETTKSSSAGGTVSSLINLQQQPSHGDHTREEVVLGPQAATARAGRLSKPQSMRDTSNQRLSRASGNAPNETGSFHNGERPKTSQSVKTIQKDYSDGAHGSAGEIKARDTPSSPRQRRALNIFGRRKGSEIAPTQAAPSPADHTDKADGPASDQAKVASHHAKSSLLRRLSGRRHQQRDTAVGASQIDELPTISDSETTSKMHETEAENQKEPRCSRHKRGSSSVDARSCSATRKGRRRGVLQEDMQPRPIKVRTKHKSPRETGFSNLFLAQELDLLALPVSASVESQSGVPKAMGESMSPLAENGDTKGHEQKRATRAMRFSLDGRYLAVGGQDGVIRVFAVLDSEEARKVAMQSPPSSQFSSPAMSPTRVRIGTQQAPTAVSNTCPKPDGSLGSKSSRCGHPSLSLDCVLPALPVFAREPIKEFRGHTSDVLDLNWSKGGFLLSAGMDKTARVWHLSFDNCLVSFVHEDFVTSAVFHPRDDRFFLSGSLDGKLRLWNVAAKKIMYSQEVPGLITACTFTASGNTACVGLFSGAMLFYATNKLEFMSSVAVRSKTNKSGRKITGIEPILNLQSVGDDAPSAATERILISSNDSYVRIYDVGAKTMLARFKAKSYSNRESQIRATLSDDNTYIVTGSETASGPSGSDGGQVHIWECGPLLFDNESTQASLLEKMKPSKRDARGGSEASMSASSNAPIFASKSSLESGVEYFTAHASTVTCAVMAPLATSTLLRQACDPIMKRTAAKLRAKLNSGEQSSYNLVPTATMTLASESGTQRSDTLVDTGDTASSSSATNPGHPAAAGDDEACKQARILVSVDDSAVLRVWRSDPLQTVR